MFVKESLSEILWACVMQVVILKEQNGPFGLKMNIIPS